MKTCFVFLFLFSILGRIVRKDIALISPFQEFSSGRNAPDSPYISGFLFA